MEEVRGMTEIDLSRAEWRKSSYSSQSGKPGAKTKPGDVLSFLDEMRAGTNKPWHRLCWSADG